jgi:spoIIIJ-associated protein
MEKQSVEVTGATVEEAVEGGLAQLGVSRSDVVVEVLEKPVPGLFGRTRGEAKVRLVIGSKQNPRGDKVAITRTRPEPSVESVAATAEVATKFVAELISLLGYEAEIKASDNGGEVSIAVEGPRINELIGEKGSTLAAIEDLTRGAVSAALGSARARVSLDIQGYRQRRHDALTQYVARVVAEVERTGRARTLEPMNAADRKVVHDAAGKFAGVQTRSEGSEPRRQVTVFPSA